nr:23S rRNA (pseudouridine(1915)-N(3))-methyltransferase RlmH [Helicobacteraceae bacterium]
THPLKKRDSGKFSTLITDKIAIKFFIGGAYGLEEPFLKRCDKVISLGKITMSHKIAKVVLLEQIYRGFSILSNHPYHK